LFMELRREASSRKFTFSGRDRKRCPFLGNDAETRRHGEGATCFAGVQALACPEQPKGCTPTSRLPITVSPCQPNQGCVPQSTSSFQYEKDASLRFLRRDSRRKRRALGRSRFPPLRKPGKSPSPRRRLLERTGPAMWCPYIPA